MAGTKATCYRLCGDEFSMLIDNSTDIHHINHFTQTILDNMATPLIIHKQKFVLGASLGIAFYPEDGKNPQELLKMPTQPCILLNMLGAISNNSLGVK